MRAKHRRRILGAFILIWLGPGTVATYLFAHSIVWLQVQSWLAMLFALVGAFAAETPVEEEA